MEDGVSDWGVCEKCWSKGIQKDMGKVQVGGEGVTFVLVLFKFPAWD